MSNILTLGNILKIFKKHLALIISSTIIIGCMAGVYATIIATPKYSAYTQLIAKAAPENGNLSVGQVQATTQMSTTLSQVLVSPVILNQVIHNLKLEMSTAELKDHLTVVANSNSQVMTLTVTSTVPSTASEIANEIAAIFIKKAPELTNVSTVSVLAKAITNTTPTSPNKRLIVAAGVIAGLIIGLSLSLMLSLFNTRVTSQADLEALNINVLGQISTNQTSN